MPEYLSPGVYIEEIEIGAKPIEGVSTSTAGFLGETERGPTLPTLVTSFPDYQRVFGTYFGATKFLPYAVSGFFENGGKRCYIGRIVSSGVTKASQTLYAGGTKALFIEAIGEGYWGQRIAIITKKNADNKTFKLTVLYWKDTITNATVFDPSDVETNRKKVQPLSVVYNNVSVESDSQFFFETTVNGNSNLIRLGAPQSGEPLAIPDDTGNTPKLLDNVTGTEKTKLDITDYEGNVTVAPGSRTGLAGIADIDDISILYIPEMQSIIGLAEKVIVQCEMLRDRFAIIDIKKGIGIPDSNAKDNIDTKYAALYSPWITIVDPVSNGPLTIPPGGHIAGIYARSDNNVGVFKAPANEVVSKVRSLEYPFSKGIQETLNPIGINCIRMFLGRGIRVWGARTLSSDPLWKYINVRRLFIFLEKSIENGTQWVVFEPNNEKLWDRVKQTIVQFLTTQWKTGALMGKTPEEAFFVKCDRTTMTQDDIDNGRLIVIIGVAPTKPAEFVIFRIAQWQGGSAATE